MENPSTHIPEIISPQHQQSNGQLFPMPNLSGLNGLGGWVDSLQKYANDNPTLVAIFGAGLLLLAYNSYNQSQSQSQSKNHK